MSALITGNRYSLGIFLYGRIHDFSGRSIMPDVDDFGSGVLQNSSHDVDGGIMPVKQGGGRNNFNGVFLGCKPRSLCSSQLPFRPLKLFSQAS